LRSWTWATDAVLLLTSLGVFAVFIAIVAGTWFRPFPTAAAIAHSPWALPGYAASSLLRIVIAYGLSLVFALLYGYAAASSPAAERFLIPLLDVLQSLPVLSFLPGVMLAMAALAPHRQLGLELASILLIFSGEVWNLAFSFYASLRATPPELREAARLFGFSRWQRFRQLDLPAAAISLTWNSMMSVAGGWFFLMACETYVLGNRSFRLPGIGSYLAQAAAADDWTAIAWGLAAMVALIVLLDQLIWRPAIAWSQKFRLEQVESGPAPSSWAWNWWRRSRLLPGLESLWASLVRQPPPVKGVCSPRQERRRRGFSAPLVWGGRLLLVVAGGAAIYGCWTLAALLRGITVSELARVGLSLAATLARVVATLAIATAWTLPAGVAIGTRPRWARLAQPLAQIAASVPATALFPVLLLVLTGAGRGLGLGSILLMLMGTQWYILFNVIAGVAAIPGDLKEAATVFRFRRFENWRRLILPGIFPYLLTGWVTAAGGAWNASIVAEYFQFRGHTLSTLGIGALISQATSEGNMRLLVAATLALAALVTAINRLVWRPLYRLAARRFVWQA
jgi:NitT/TauT family transport system permease protein